MLPREVVEMYGDMNNWENVVGTGGFMLSDFVASSSLTYTKNPSYWSTDPVNPENPVPYLDKVKLLVISDLSSQQAAFRTGKVDMMSNVSVEDWELFTQQNPEMQYSATWPWIPTFPCGRLDKDLPFNDLRVRRALNLAVDQEAILEGLYKGHGAMLGYPFVPSKSMSDVYVPLEEMPESVQEGLLETGELAGLNLGLIGNLAQGDEPVVLVADHGESVLSRQDGELVNVGGLAALQDVSDDLLLQVFVSSGQLLSRSIADVLLALGLPAMGTRR